MDRFKRIGAHVRASMERRRWLQYSFAISGTCLLILEAFYYKGSNDFRYVGLYLVYVALPFGLMQIGLVAFSAWHRWREGWFKEQAKINAMLAAADARGEDPDKVYEAYIAEKHPEEFELTPPPSPQRTLSDAEIAQIHIDVAFQVEVFWAQRLQQRLLVVATILAEEGLFFAPIALFGWPWWAMALSVLAWGFMHYPVKNGLQCLGTSGFGMLVGLTVLRHGILVNAVGHIIHDYIIFASHRFLERMNTKLCV